jgi:hypothetical protein
LQSKIEHLNAVLEKHADALCARRVPGRNRRSDPRCRSPFLARLRPPPPHSAACAVGGPSVCMNSIR